MAPNFAAQFALQYNLGMARFCRGFAALAMVVLLTLTLVLTFGGRKYKGDGTFTDNGILSPVPRYVIRFPQISLEKPGKHIFVCEGLPTVPLSFALEISDLHKHDDEQRAFFQQHPNQKWPGTSEKDKYEEIKKIRTRVELSISTGGQTACNISGSMRDSWTLAWAPAVNSGFFWHPAGQDMKFSPNRSYTVSLTIEDVDAAPLLVVPTLSGGGMELP
jgi:hypothetical protein